MALFVSKSCRGTVLRPACCTSEAAQSATSTTSRKPRCTALGPRAIVLAESAADFPGVCHRAASTGLTPAPYVHARARRCWHAAPGARHICLLRQAAWAPVTFQSCSRTGPVCSLSATSVNDVPSGRTGKCKRRFIVHSCWHHGGWLAVVASRALVARDLNAGVVCTSRCLPPPHPTHSHTRIHAYTPHPFHTKHREER